MSIGNTVVDNYNLYVGHVYIDLLLTNFSGRNHMDWYVCVVRSSTRSWWWQGWWFKPLSVLTVTLHTCCWHIVILICPNAETLVLACIVWCHVSRVMWMMVMKVMESVATEHAESVQPWLCQLSLTDLAVLLHPIHTRVKLLVNDNKLVQTLVLLSVKWLPIQNFSLLLWSYCRKMWT